MNPFTSGMVLAGMGGAELFARFALALGACTLAVYFAVSMLALAEKVDPPVALVLGGAVLAALVAAAALVFLALGAEL